MTNDIIPSNAEGSSSNNPIDQARIVHQAMQQIKSVTGNAVKSAVLEGGVLYQSRDEDNFSLTANKIHYEENNGLSHLVQPTRDMSPRDQLDQLRQQTHLNQTQRAFFTGQSQGNASKIENQHNLLELDDED